MPGEETLFYLLTAAMVVQGFVVFWHGAGDPWRLLALAHAVKRRLAPSKRELPSPAPASESTPVP